MGRLGSGRDAQTNLRLGSTPTNQVHRRSPAASDIRQYFDALEGLIDRVAKEGTYEGRHASHTLAVHYTDDFLADYYQEIGLTWAVNSPYLRFHGF